MEHCRHILFKIGGTNSNDLRSLCRRDQMSPESCGSRGLYLLIVSKPSKERGASLIVPAIVAKCGHRLGPTMVRIARYFGSLITPLWKGRKQRWRDLLSRCLELANDISRGQSPG